jgi:hypothetical protein
MKVFCKDCKWREGGLVYSKCKNPKTFWHIGGATDPVTGIYREPMDVPTYCTIVNSNCNCEYFEPRKRKWYESILW